MEETWRKLFRPGTKVIALPNWRQPRLYLNAANFHLRWTGSRLYPASRWTALIFRYFMRTKGLLFPGPAYQSGNEYFLDEFLQMRQCSELIPSTLLVGTQNAAKKMILELRDQSGSIAAYFKYGCSRAAQKRISHEYSVLAALPVGLAPKPLHFDAQVGLLISPGLGRRVSARFQIPKNVSRYLASIPVMDHRPGNSHPWLAQFFSSDIPVISAAASQLAAREWAVLPVHGDFAPWNLLQKGNQITAVDWEYGTLDGFPGVDMAYYLLQIGALINRWPPEKALHKTTRILTEVDWLNVNHRQAQAITMLTAFDAYKKALQDGTMSDSHYRFWHQKFWI